MSLNIIPKCSELFSGRGKELNKLEQIFNNTNFFYIEGISGIGKTSLMSKWADILLNRSGYKEEILWLKCLDDWTIETLLMEIDEWLVSMGEVSIKEFITTKKIVGIEEKTLYIANQLNKKKYILFIDDFQNIKQETAGIFIDIFKNYIRHSRIYVITQNALSIHPVEYVDIGRIRVRELEHEDSLTFLKKIFALHDSETIPDRKILEGIIEKSHGHPFFLKTFSGMILSRMSTIENIIEGKYIWEDTGKVIFEKLLGNLLSEENFILEILSASRLSLTSEIIKELSNLENYSHILSLLENKIVIEKDQNCRYLLHPLLKDHIWNVMTEDRKIFIHNLLALYFEKNAELFRESFYHYINGGNPVKAGNIFENFMENLYSGGYYEEISEKLALLEKHILLTGYMRIMKANILLLNGKWEESLAILEEMNDNNISDENLRGEIYFSLADIYRCRSNISSAISFYEDSLKIFRRFGNSKKVLQVIKELASTYRFTGELDKASRFVQESFEIAEKANNEIDMADALHLKGIIFLQEENFEKALNISEKLFALGERVNSISFINKAFHINGRAFLGLEKYDEAIKSFEANLSSGKNLRDKFVIAQAYRGLSRVFYEKGDVEKSIECIEKSIENNNAIGNKLGAAIDKYALADMMEVKGEFKKAIDLYSESIKKGEELSLKKLELASEIRIIKNRLKIKELNPSLEELIKLKNKIPEYLTKERIEINLILADIYMKQYKHKEKELLLNEALKLGEKSCDLYGFSKTCYMIYKISDREKNEKEAMKKMAEECFEKLVVSEKRTLKTFFYEIDKKTEERYVFKNRDNEAPIDDSGLENLRNKKDEYEFFIDVPGKCAFEKEKGEINIFKKIRLLSLLLFFIHNKGKEFSLEEIHKEIWEWKYEGYVSDKEVRKNISRLRRLIEPDEENPKYILHREGIVGKKGKYYFNDKANFCLINS